MVNKCLIAFVAAKIVQRDNVNVRAHARARAVSFVGTLLLPTYHPTWSFREWRFISCQS